MYQKKNKLPHNKKAALLKLSLSVRYNMALTKYRGLFFILLFLLLTSCSSEKLTQQQKFVAYTNALHRTENLSKKDLQSDPEFVASIMERISNYYGDLTVENVERFTNQVYAENSFLCDTLHIANGADEIQDYFTITAGRVNTMRVRILDYSASGKEIYARWTMTISAENLADGAPVTTYGMSHFRLNQEGKVILHQDFWDASAGFFELLPGFEEVIQRLRGNM